MLNTSPEIIWNAAPEWATYAAQDSDGTWHWYEKKPHSRIEEGIWYAYGRHKPCAFQRPTWAKTVHRRPDDQASA